MYFGHKIVIIITFALTSLISFLIKINYIEIAEIAVTVVSIALAVYISAATALLGSAYAKRMRKQQDKKIKDKSSLGVLANYLQNAGALGLATIIISCAYISKAFCCEHEFLVIFVSALSTGIFAVNLLFIWIILKFILTAMLNSVI